MKIPKKLLEPFKNPFVEAKRQELASAMTKTLLNEALRDRKKAELAKQQAKGEKPPGSA